MIAEMALIQRKTEEQRAEVAERKERERRENEERARAERIRKARQAFFRTPAGRARVAFERGDHVFQYSFNVIAQQAIIIAMVGSRTSQKTSDPVAVLNSVCHEGWELVNGSFVFVEQGQESRDKFMSSGQNVAIKGATVGYYLFRRSPSNRRDPLPYPWESTEDEVEELICSECDTAVDPGATGCIACGAVFEESE